jgi:hypothetical protein
MQVFCTITAKNGERVPIQVSDDATPTSLRQQASLATKIPLGQLRLIFRGRMVKDDDSKNAVEEYKLEPDSVLHCMGKPDETATDAVVGGGSNFLSSNAPNTSSATADTPNTASVAPIISESAVTFGLPPAVVPTEATSTAGPLTVAAAILKLRQNNPPSVYETALTTLDKILNNIVGHPLEDKYRQVKRQNPAFSKRLGGLVGGHDCMLAVGFHVEGEGSAQIYHLHASAEQWPKLVQAKSEVATAVEQVKQQQQQWPMPHSAAAPVNNSNPFGASMVGGTPGLIPPDAGSMPPLDPNMQNTISQMMSNPETLRAALQVRDGSINIGRK